MRSERIRCQCERVCRARPKSPTFAAMTSRLNPCLAFQQVRGDEVGMGTDKFGIAWIVDMTENP